MLAAARQRTTNTSVYATAYSLMRSSGTSSDEAARLARHLLEKLRQRRQFLRARRAI